MHRLCENAIPFSTKVGHPWILLLTGGPGTKPSRIPRENCSYYVHFIDKEFETCYVSSPNSFVEILFPTVIILGPDEVMEVGLL